MNELRARSQYLIDPGVFVTFKKFFPLNSYLTLRRKEESIQVTAHPVPPPAPVGGPSSIK